MSDYTISTTLTQPYDDAVEAVRTALGEQGFGILTEIDLKATLKAKLDVDVAPQVILGACRPALAYEALTAEPSIAAVLPCNVVVRAVDDTTTVVEAFDPDAMMGLADNEALHAVAADAKQRITAALASLDANEGDN
ncbi:DUF302 domain-containing protein [Nocardioides seonyuensis]|uniref:DUF302 domain-containing protein n=1 Tax=Nocardioides seonyuensis TaxID=2518371 RepID=A0A4P7IEN8_9ACTN|nr:DUF302 domain-containing protein [Nocardioides seonyuensis]QBX54407.1 DUF302 domain-containing protein [Nocardioides seonyuensis]